MDYTLELYRQMFSNLRRGLVRGTPSPAKPIFLISLIDYLQRIKVNALNWGNPDFENAYISNYSLMNLLGATPLWIPFFYMSSEPFYTLVWRAEPPEEMLKRPSTRLLREYLDHAELDQELWGLIKDKDNRTYLRNQIIAHYFTTDSHGNGI